MHLQAVVLTLAASLALCGEASAQECLRMFRSEWYEAEAYVAEHGEQWKQVFDTFEVPCLVAEAVVFPELLRYSKLKDRLESSAVKGLYVAGGVKSANFSIGIFQMKPSFAEEVEREWTAGEYPEEYRLYFDLRNGKEARSARVSRLDDERWQTVYLSIFLKLLYRRFPKLATLCGEDQVKFLATAYNVSFTASYETIEHSFGISRFNTDFLPTSSTVCVPYWAVALEHYKQSVFGANNPSTKPSRVLLHCKQ